VSDRSSRTVWWAVGLSLFGMSLGIAARASSEAPVEPQELRIAFLGDSGAGGPDQKAVARQLRRFRGELRHVFMLGDNVYYSGQAKRFRAAFHSIYAPFLSPSREGHEAVRFHAALGNHDVKPCVLAHSGGRLDRDHRAYSPGKGCDVKAQLDDPAFGYEEGRRYYRVPLKDPATNGILAEVYVLDSETLPSEKHACGCDPDPDQLTWLGRELEAPGTFAPDRDSAAWRIVTLHRPLRTPSAKGFLLGKGGHGEDGTILAAMRPFLETGRIDVVFAGHNHFYARLPPDEFGVRHFVSGGGGVSVYEPIKPKDLVASGGGFHHFVTAILTRERFEYCVIDSLGRIRDHGEWTREARGKPDRPLTPDRRRRVCGR
jgi:hypothetical protein